MIIGRYPPTFGPQQVADVFTVLLLERRAKGFSKNNSDKRLGPYSKGDGHWQLDDTNTFWIRVNASEQQYTLSCLYERDNGTLDELKRQFETQYLKAKK
jgi:hypothetical protein